MKKVLLIAIASFFLTNCTTDNANNPAAAAMETSIPEVLTNASVDNSDSAARAIQNSTIVSLSGSTRGFSSSITIANRKVIKNSTGVVPPTSEFISVAKWATFKQKFNALNLELIPLYPAPSCKSCYDGDIAENLEITYDNVQYRSKMFDRTNPPAAIKDFITFMRTL